MSSPVAPPPSAGGAPQPDTSGGRPDAAVEEAAVRLAAEADSAFSGATEAEVCAEVLGERRHGL